MFSQGEMPWEKGDVMRNGNRAATTAALRQMERWAATRRLRGEGDDASLLADEAEDLAHKELMLVASGRPVPAWLVQAQAENEVARAVSFVRRYKAHGREAAEALLARLNAEDRPEWEGYLRGRIREIPGVVLGGSRGEYTVADSSAKVASLLARLNAAQRPEWIEHLLRQIREIPGVTLERAQGNYTISWA